MKSKTQKANLLKKLNAKWATNCTCKLKATATQPVYGLGNPDTEIVFIGEAPGKTEDISGIPFAGSAGKVLNTMLESINLKREAIYITNIVKYRPPNNRDPLPAEKQACRQWLIGELEIVSPRLVVFLGRHAMHNFFPEEKISISHGKVIRGEFREIPTKYFFSLYHPAASIYNGAMKKAMEKDFKKIPKVLKDIKKRI